MLSGSDALIDEARKWRKMLGGAMRQVGLIAAAGQHAIDNHIDRLAHDHRNAETLAQGLAGIDGLEVDAQNTNMVFVRAIGDSAGLENRLSNRGVLTRWSGNASRMVLHLDVSEADVATVITSFTEELTC